MNPIFEIQRNYLIIRVEGELDHYMAERIRQKSDTYLEGTRVKHVVFDFKNATFMDSSGIGVIMGRYKQVKRLDGHLYVINVNPTIDRILMISGLHKLVKKSNPFEISEDN